MADKTGPEGAGPTAALSQLAERFRKEDVRVLQSFLDLKSGDIEQAAQHYTDVQTWRDAIGPVSISTIEKFLRSGTYMIPLQYPAPDGGYQHPPIILMDGMVRGTRDEMVKQVIWCVETAWRCMPPGTPRVKFIINTRNSSFRIPDAAFRASVFDTMRYKYPWLINCKVIFLDVMAPIAAVLTTVGRFFEKVYTERFQLAKSSDWAAADPDLKAFAQHCPPGWAPCWDEARKLRFDMEGFIRDRRAAEEAQADESGSADASSVEALEQQLGAVDINT